MNTSNDLLHLIVSMTKQEKRYFKLYAAFYNKDNGNHCLQLFEVIDKHRPNDDTELAEHVHGKPYGQRLAALKNQLLEQVLDCLTAFHSSRLASFKIRRMLTHADILYHKGLYNHCRKLLARTEKKALEIEYHEIMPAILSRKRSLLLKELSTSFEEAIDALYTQNDVALAILTRINSYRKLMDSMQMLAARYGTRPTDSDRQALTALAQHPLMRDESLADTFDARLARLSTLGTHALLTNESHDATTYYRQAVQLWKNSPALIEERPLQYRRYLMNYLSCLLPTSDEEEFSSVIRDIRTVVPSFPEEHSEATGTIWNIELLYYLNKGRLDKCTEVAAALEKHIARNAEEFSPTTYITLCHNCTIVYFLTGRYHKALEYINAILNERRIEIKRDLHNFARVISLITHYELRNVDILDNMLRSTKRFLQQREPVGDLEPVVLRALRDILSSADAHALHRVFTALYSQLAEQLHTTDGPEQPGLAELLFWTESTLCKRPIAELFAERVASPHSTTLRAMFSAIPPCAQV